MRASVNRFTAPACRVLALSGDESLEVRSHGASFERARLRIEAPDRAERFARTQLGVLRGSRIAQCERTCSVSEM